MLRKLRVVTVLVFTVCVLASAAFSASFPLGMIVLSETPYELFGALHYPFIFQISAPIEYVLCEDGVASTGGCVDGNISDVVCVINNSAPHGVVAMISDTETPLSLGNLPPDFPCQNSSVAPTVVFLPETGKPQTLTGKGLPTTLAGAVGPIVTIVATSDLDTTPPKATSDMLVVTGKPAPEE